MDNRFCTQTSIPIPHGIDYRSLWTDSPYSETDTVPRWKQFKYPDLFVSNNESYMHEIFTPPIAQVLDILGPNFVRVFRWYPGKIGTWHIDGNVQNKIECAINWVVEGKGLIQWDRNLKLLVPEPGTPTAAFSFGAKQGVLEDYAEYSHIGHACLVNTGVPHRAINTEPIHRITISLAFKQVTYEQACELLMKHNLLKID
jgi:hypothetical protein